MTKFGKEGESKLSALIGDIVDSRKIEHRLQVQTKLEALLSALNRTVAPNLLAAPLALTAGDEIQGLFHCPKAAVAIVVQISEELHPVRLVYGFGYGPLTTELRQETALMDGPCFHNARAALEQGQKSRQWFVAQGFGPIIDEAVSALFQLMWAIRSRWTDKQLAYVRAARQALQKDVAAHFGVSTSVVSESLKAAAFSAIREGEQAAQQLLEQFEQF